jgi:hypothetical protein
MGENQTMAGNVIPFPVAEAEEEGTAFEDSVWRLAGMVADEHAPSVALAWVAVRADGSVASDWVLEAEAKVALLRGLAEACCGLAGPAEPAARKRSGAG